MDKSELIFNAVGALLANKLRTGLAVLGLVVGISSLVAIVALIDGASAYITERIVTLQPDVFQVSQLPANILNVNDFIKASKWKRIEYEDYRAVRERCRECAAVGAESDLMGRVKYRNRITGSVQVRGLSATMFDIERVEVETGRFFNDAEERESSAVCLLGAEIVDEFFLGADPLGAELNVLGKTFRVIGVIARRGSLFGRSQDRFLIIPLTTMMRRFGAHQATTIYCQQRDSGPQSTAAATTSAAASAIDEVRQIMRVRRELMPTEEDTFFIITSDSALSIYQTVIGGFYLVTVLISGIALTVGGLGVTNIMLVNVRERTREIGLRRAVGARSRDVLWQFLVETIALCVLGGLLGTGTGMLIASLISWTTPLPASSRPIIAVLGFAVSSILGLVSGIYPARRASRLSPIEALRYE